MPNFDWLLQCVEDKMDMSQDLWTALVFMLFVFLVVSVCANWIEIIPIILVAILKNLNALCGK